MKKIGLPSFVTVRRPRGGSRPRCRLRVLRVHHVKINALRRVHGGAGTGAAAPQCRTVIATTGAGTSTPMASTTCATPFDDAGAAHLLALARLGTWTLTAALLGRARRAPGLRRNLRRLLHDRASEVPERGLAGFQEPRRPEPPRQR